MKYAALLLVLLAFVATACGSSDDDAAPTTSEEAAAPRPALFDGVWHGELTPMNHPDMATQLNYIVSHDDMGHLTLAIGNPDHGILSTRDLALDGDTLRFVFDEPEENAALRCALGLQETGQYIGRCTDADGKWARFTMTPPAS